MNIGRPGNDSKLALSAEPSVQLIPPSVAEREKALGTQRMAALLAVLAIVVVLAATGFGFVQSAQAQQALTDANNKTAELLTEEGKYSQGTQVKNELTEREQSIVVGGSTDLDYVGMVALLGTVQPKGSTYADLSISTRTPWDGLLAPEGALRRDRSVIVTFTLNQASGKDQVSQFLTAVSALPAVSDAYVYNIDEKGGAQITVTFSDAVYSQRFTLDNVRAMETAAPVAPTATPEPTDTPTPDATEGTNP